MKIILPDMLVPALTIKGDTLEELTQNRMKLFEMEVTIPDWVRTVLERDILICKGQEYPVVYQEDLIQLCIDTAGFTAAEGYAFIKACCLHRMHIIHRHALKFRADAKARKPARALDWDGYIETVLSYIRENSKISICKAVVNAYREVWEQENSPGFKPGHLTFLMEDAR